MTDKPAFEALLDELLVKRWRDGDRDWSYLPPDTYETRAAVLAAYDAAAGSDRPCTCHPDDKPPVPCPKKYALTECRDAAAGREGQPVAWCIRAYGELLYNEGGTNKADVESNLRRNWDREVENGDAELVALYTHRAPKADAAAVPLSPTPEMIEAGAQRLVSWEDGCVWPDSWDALQVAAARNEAERVWRSMWLAASPARGGEGEKDAARLNFIQREFIKVEPIEHPTGGGDSDVGWRLTDFYMAEPRERIVAEVFNDDLRSAIDAAMSREAQ